MSGLLYSYLVALALGVCLTATRHLAATWLRDLEPHPVCSRPVQELSRNATSPVRLFCWIQVPFMMPLQAMMMINATWGPRCAEFAFVTQKLALGTVNLPTLEVNATDFNPEELRAFQWKRLWLSAWRLHSGDALARFDFFLLANTGNYVIVENLLHLLRFEDPSEPVVFGRRMLLNRQGGGEGEYLSGKAGIVLSRGALGTLVKRGFSGASSDARTKQFCGFQSVTRQYDIQLAECMQSVGIKIKDSLDTEGRERFHPVAPAEVIERDRMPAWLKLESYHRPVNACMSCPSPNSITFSGVEEFYKLDAAIYHVRPVED